jgi:hypothetical protein
MCSFTSSFVMRAVSVPCEFSVVVSGGTARWQKLVGFVEALDGVVKNKCCKLDERNYGKMFHLFLL